MWAVLLSPQYDDCNTLQHTHATCCNMLQHAGGSTRHRSTSTEAHFNILQHTATHCNARGSLLFAAALLYKSDQSLYSCTATYCNALERSETHGNALQRTAPHNALPIVSVRSDSAEALLLFFWTCALKACLLMRISTPYVCMIM